MDNLRDYTPTKETITLHGLGFIQLKLTETLRMHVWHPELPRRKCYEHSSVHNHRFGFSSLVLRGEMINQRAEVEIDPKGTHALISHNGSRLKTGSRKSFVAARCNILMRPPECIPAGGKYVMTPYEYHCTPVDDIVVTIMEKQNLGGKVHATSTCRRDIRFDMDFNRFQLSEDELYAYVKDALNS